MEEQNRLCTPEEVAKYFRVPLSWVYRKTRERAIPFLKVGRYCRFEMAVIEKWAREHGVQE
jgi:excisionase family DNA binding protein